MKIEASDLDFAGKRALVTGAASGIGAAMARTFHAHGATVILADRDAAGLAEIQAELAGSESVGFDQADLVSIERLADAVGHVDILLNNAGVLWAGPFAEMPMVEMDRLVTINMLGPMRVAHVIGQGMLARGSGTIVNTSSQLAFHGSAERAVYASTKAGLSQFTKSIAAEWAPRGVRVVAIAPGRTLTNINSYLLDDAEKHALALEGIPAGRLAEAHEMARLALLLASDVLGYVVGETVVSDGGYVLR
jgi:NAD(P)-dependent dehydrogenase (short-subunit alcohol dehydrogenase family)